MPTLREQFTSLFKLPQARQQAQESQTQQRAIEARLNAAQPALTAPVISAEAPIRPSAQPPAVQPPVAQPPIPAPETPALTPAPAEAPRPDIEAIQRGLEGVKTQLETLRDEVGDDKIKEIEKKVLEGMQLTPEEQDIENRVNALLSEEESGRILIGGRPIEGQKRALTREAQAQLVPLQRQLALLQSRRAGAMEVAKTELGFERERRKEQIEEDKDREKEEKEREKEQEAREEEAKKLDEPLSVAEAKSLGVPFGTTRREAFGKVPVAPGSARGTGLFNPETGEELNPFQAANSIIEANPNASEAELINAIRENVVNDKGTQLVSVEDAQRLARESIAKRPAPTISEIKQKIVDVLLPRKDTFSRSEARTAAENQLKTSLGLKAGQSLPKTYKDAIEDALVEVYGRTFFQSILPGGR